MCWCLLCSVLFGAVLCGSVVFARLFVCCLFVCAFCLLCPPCATRVWAGVTKLNCILRVLALLAQGRACLPGGMHSLCRVIFLHPPALLRVRMGDRVIWVRISEHPFLGVGYRVADLVLGGILLCKTVCCAEAVFQRALRSSLGARRCITS